jgi:hypothetical protein
MTIKFIVYCELALSYLKYLFLFYWTKYIAIYFYSPNCKINKIHLYKNDNMIQDITSKFTNKKQINWNDIITYRAIRQINTTDVFFIYIEYEYFGETGHLLLHEGKTLKLPIYEGYTAETLKKYTDRIRLISATLVTARDNVDFEDDSIFDSFIKFEGVRKNFHRIEGYEFYVSDFMYYLAAHNKMSVDDIHQARLIISDYKLNDFEFRANQVFHI